MVERVIAACDGAAKGNPGPAAWAYVVADSAGAPTRWEAGPLGHSTNNIGELTALERLLAATDPAVPLEVRLDSTYTRDAATKWLVAWKRNGWKTAAGKPVANRELIQRIDALLEGREVTFVYVPAHQVDGDPLNAVADKAASDAARTQEAAAGTAADLPVPDPVSASASRSSRPAAASGAARKTSAGAARGASSGGGRTLSARFAGTCPCSRPYAKGDKITKVGGSWGHPQCAGAAV
ncbi:ribonuclease HI [Kitasatospora herbaricolor]|uniref:ribonuclease H family protein n=1 Tax=Kitasatospora herbaricolor TaxID=68217 RepID=UPI00174DCD05|nr:ribonuclease H [Kitasatospora herbaricolor]MDQ0312963.1 ribonuclease HI [Kitasatospora herbaricolor]GGV25046.1 ribonuclease HI [Kitasatospora herbaricolor]